MHFEQPAPRLSCPQTPTWQASAPAPHADASHTSCRCLACLMPMPTMSYADASHYTVPMPVPTHADALHAAL